MNNWAPDPVPSRSLGSANDLDASSDHLLNNSASLIPCKLAAVTDSTPASSPAPSRKGIAFARCFQRLVFQLALFATLGLVTSVAVAAIIWKLGVTLDRPFIDRYAKYNGRWYMIQLSEKRGYEFGTIRCSEGSLVNGPFATAFIFDQASTGATHPVPADRIGSLPARCRIPEQFSMAFTYAVGWPCRSLRGSCQIDWPNQKVHYFGFLPPASDRSRSTFEQLARDHLPIAPVWTGLIINSLVFGFPTWVFWTIYTSARRFRRKGHCRRCSYDLAGVPTNRCPECGLEFQAKPQLKSPT